MADKIFLQDDEISTKNIKKAVSLLKKVSNVKEANFLETSLNDIAFKMQMGVENSYGGLFLSNASEEAESIAGELEAVAANLASLQKLLTDSPEVFFDADRAFKGWNRREIAEPKGKVKKFLEMFGLGFIWKLFNIDDNNPTEVVLPSDIDDTDTKITETPPVTPVITIQNYDFPTNRAMRVTAKKTNAEGHRSADAYLEVVDSFDVENTSRYQQYNGDTYCNIYVWDVTSAMGCEIPHWVDTSGVPTEVGASGAKELCAEGSKDWLANHGEEYGWYECSPDEAIEMANNGYPTVACDTAGDHIAMVVPQYEGESGVQISQAGWKNMSHASVNWGWDKSYTLKYYYHK